MNITDVRVRKITKEGKLYSSNKHLGISTGYALLSGIFGSIFALWLIYAAGLEYLLMSIIFLAIGIPVYIRARRERGLAVFSSSKEKFFAVCIAVVALIAISSVIVKNLHIHSNGVITAAPSTSVEKTKDAKIDKKPAPLTKRHGENVILEIESEEIFY